VCSRGARRRRTEDRRVRSGERDVSSEAKAAAVKRCDEEEIKEDFMAVVGYRQPRRPKKRPRTVQKKLHSLHPAFSRLHRAHVQDKLEKGPLEQWNQVSRAMEPHLPCLLPCFHCG
ncbi:unnamed protein product, partial [Brassica oleracea var. botrytis]